MLKFCNLNEQQIKNIYLSQFITMILNNHENIASFIINLKFFVSIWYFYW